MKNWKGVLVKMENKRGGRDKGQRERNNGRKGGLRYDGDKILRGKGVEGTYGAGELGGIIRESCGTNFLWGWGRGASVGVEMRERGNLDAEILR